MQKRKAIRLAKEATNQITQPGELVPVADTTIVGIDWQGKWWVTDNGEAVVDLSKEQAIEIIVENLTS